MRTTYRYDRATGQLYQVGRGLPMPAGLTIVRDLAPYRSPIDGTVIGSRRDLAEHCKAHGVRVVEPSETLLRRSGGYRNPKYGPTADR